MSREDSKQTTDILTALDEARRYTEGDESAAAAVHKPRLLVEAVFVTKEELIADGYEFEPTTPPHPR